MTYIKNFLNRIYNLFADIFAGLTFLVIAVLTSILIVLNLLFSGVIIIFASLIVLIGKNNNITKYTQEKQE